MTNSLNYCRSCISFFCASRDSFARIFSEKRIPCIKEYKKMKYSSRGPKTSRRIGYLLFGKKVDRSRRRAWQCTYKYESSCCNSPFVSINYAIVTAASKKNLGIYTQVIFQIKKKLVSVTEIYGSSICFCSSASSSEIWKHNNKFVNINGASHLLSFAHSKQT